jgi:predicted nuclease of predicted toxin-antitoxin system
MAKLMSKVDAELYNNMLKRLKELDEKALKEKPPENQIRDILIAFTSIKNSLILVTEDENLKTVVQEFQGYVRTISEKRIF